MTRKHLSFRPRLETLDDFNGDGYADLAVVGTNWNGTYEVEVFFWSSQKK
jgi:hypothetical protein